MGRPGGGLGLRGQAACARGASRFAAQFHAGNESELFEAMRESVQLKNPVERVEPEREIWRGFAGEIGGGPWFSVRKSPDGVAHVHVFGDVSFGPHWDGLLSEIGGGEDIRLTVSSPGGDSVFGLAFFHAFKGQIAEVKIVGCGGSAAYTMCLAGRKILIERGAKILLHAPCSFCYGEADALLHRSRTLRKVKSMLAEVLVLRTEQPDEVIAGWLDGADNYFTAEQACAYGLADEIFDAPKFDRDGLPVGISGTGAAKRDKPLPTLTDDELLFSDFLLSVGRLKVRSRADFVREVSAWAFYNADEQPEHL